MRLNHNAWEQEYQNPQFLTLGVEPLSCVKDFVKWLRRKQKVDMSNFVVLDLGCGNGKNLKYIVENYCNPPAGGGMGYDISKTAISEAKVLKGDLDIQYEVRSIGVVLPLENNSVDLVLDATSSNALNETERSIYLQEVIRVLKPGGYFFVRALCLDGDTNAKNLIKQSPGIEKDTYVLGATGITERVFSRQDFLDTYESHFEMISLEKTHGYQKWGNQSYKRNYWIAYLQIKKK